MPLMGPGEATEEARWFAQEVQPHERSLRSFLRSRVPSAADVDDVVQDSYLKLLQAKARVRIGSIRAMLFTIARNRAANLFRRQKFVSPVPVSELPEWQLIDDARDVAGSVNVQLQDALIAEAVAGLPARCREIFLLRVADGLSFAEIAAQLGLRETTVRTQVTRALEKCAAILRARGVARES